MDPSGLYSGARNGDPHNSEAQFQGRVVENAWVDQNEIKQRQLNAANVHAIHPYEKVTSKGPEICTLKTNEIALKRNHTAGTVPGKEYQDLYQPGIYDLTTNGEDNGYPFIISSFNGFFIPADDALKAHYEAAEADEKRAIIRQHWQLAGIVGTNNDQLGFHGEIGRPDLPVQLGGVYTISNFGDKTIMQGDLVVWNAPLIKRVGDGRPHVDDTPDDKLVVATEPYDPEQVFGLRSLLDLLTTFNLADPAGKKAIATRIYNLNAPNMQEQAYCTLERTRADVIEMFVRIGKYADFSVATIEQLLTDINTIPAIKKSVEKAFLSMARQRQEYNSRIVGRATTTGLPGQNFNIYMGNYCV